MPGTVDKNGKPLSQRLVLRRTQAALLLQHDVVDETVECFVDQRNAYQSK